jgi:hypothetical protein|tara:strand:- start:261009 stop:262127 length:1119 start_codon:yes stop_codon:yes gene_type:complete
MKNSFLYITFYSIFLFATACDTTGTKDEPEFPEFPLPVNEKIRELRNCCENPFGEGPPEFGTGSYFLSEWHTGEIYTVLELRRLDVQLYGTAVYTEREQFYDIDPKGSRPAIYLSKSPTEEILYLVITNESNQSIGELRALDLSMPHIPKELPPIVRDSTYNISSLRIRELSDGSLLKVYYSYGNENKGLEAGYYRLSETGPPDELLLAHSNPDGSKEIINGFDLSPDGSTLLYPIHPDLVPGPALYGGPRPELARLNLETGARETLPVQFNVQQFLWARYHPSGEKIVVSNYPREIIGFNSVDKDSMYIVDLNTYHRRPLDTRTRTHFYTADVFPSWSPDGNLLLYSSAPVGRSDFSIGKYSVFTMDMTED